MRRDISAGKFVLETLFSSAWIIDTLEILRTFKEDSLFSQSVCVAYISTIFILKSRYRDDISEDELREIILAAILMDIGKTVSDNPFEQIKATLDFYHNHGDNENIEKMIYCHFEKEDGSGLYGKKGNELLFCSKILNTSIGVERLLRSVNEYSYDTEKIEKTYMKREEFINNMNTKYDQEIVDEWKRVLALFLSEVEKVKLYLNRFFRIKEEGKTTLSVEPIEIVIRAILDNIWVLDFFAKLRENHPDFLFTHSINTAIHTASIIMLGRPDLLSRNRDYVGDIIIGSVLHDVGYIERQEINHDYHMNYELGQIEKDICKWHIVSGRKIVEDYLEQNNILNKQTIIDIVNYHHEYEDGTGIFGMESKKISLPVKIVNIANAVDLEISKATRDKNTLMFIKNDANFRVISQKYDVNIVNNVILNTRSILNNLTDLINLS